MIIYLFGMFCIVQSLACIVGLVFLASNAKILKQSREMLDIAMKEMDGYYE